MEDSKDFTASLRIFGDTLIPDEISAILGTPPSQSYQKGHKRTLSSGKEIIRNTGGWILNAGDFEHKDFDKIIDELFKKINPDPAIWKQLSEQYEMDLFCGYFMLEKSNGLSLSPKTLRAISERGIALEICLYPYIADDDGNKTFE